MLPLIGDAAGCCAARGLATFSSVAFTSSHVHSLSRGSWPAPAMTFRMLVPMRTRSHSLSRARLILSPFTNVPLRWSRDPRIQIWSPCMAMRACLRETMSSTSTMSRSLERPTRICLSVAIGNSPPWYFPLMKRRTNERTSVRSATSWAPWVRGLASLVRQKRRVPWAKKRRGLRGERANREEAGRNSEARGANCGLKRALRQG